MPIEGPLRDVKTAVLRLRDAVAALIADARSGEPPDWWLQENEVKPELEPYPEVPEPIKELYQHYDMIRHGYARPPFPPPDADPVAVDAVRTIAIETDLVIKRNNLASDRALFETALAWRSFYAVRLMSRVALGIARSEDGL